MKFFQFLLNCVMSKMTISLSPGREKHWVFWFGFVFCLWPPSWKIIYSFLEWYLNCGVYTKIKCPTVSEHQTCTLLSLPRNYLTLNSWEFHVLWANWSELAGVLQIQQLISFLKGYHKSRAPLAAWGWVRAGKKCQLREKKSSFSLFFLFLWQLQAKFWWNVKISHPTKATFLLQLCIC